VPVLEGYEVSANIAAEGLNRIAVEDDKIISVKGTTGQFVLDKDDALGQIYIKPTPEAKDKPIHLYISTESGSTYSLSLTSSEISPESIVLIPEKKVEQNWEKSASYENSSKEIIKAMHTQSFEGYTVDKAKIRLPKIRDIHVTHLQTYLGVKLFGEVLEVRNNLNEDTLLNESDFYWEGVRAVSIVDKILPAKGKTRVYLVRG
jgi:type-F conjugative transfer system secretin TraK